MIRSRGRAHEATSQMTYRERKRYRRERKPSKMLLAAVRAPAGGGDRGAVAGRLRAVGRRLGATAGLAEAGRPGHELGGVRRRRHPARLHPVRRDQDADPAAADPGVDAGRDDRDRGRALLPARRRRLRGHRARRLQEPRGRQDGRGRLDDHAAAGAQPLRRPRAHAASGRSARRAWPRSWRTATPSAGSWRAT